MLLVLETVWACLSVGISAVCCVPIWNIPKLIHYRHFQYTSSSACLFSSLAAIQRNWMALWFCLDGFVAGYTIIKLCCNFCKGTFKCAVLGKCLPVCLLCQMCRYVRVCHLYCHSSGMDFSLTCLIGVITWNILISFLVSLILFDCRARYCTGSGYSFGYLS
jgi:hypothetical protein